MKVLKKNELRDFYCGQFVDRFEYLLEFVEKKDHERQTVFDFESPYSEKYSVCLKHVSGTLQVSVLYSEWDSVTKLMKKFHGTIQTLEYPMTQSLKYIFNDVWNWIGGEHW